MHVPYLVLSVFPGIDLFGRAFEQTGFHVLRGPDLLWGSRIEDFTPLAGVFEGIIGGSPCQDFSRARRAPSSGYGVQMVTEFARVVTVAGPLWFVLENVPGVPTVEVEGYDVQRLNLRDTECGGRQRRLRAFQFGSRERLQLCIPRTNDTSRPPLPAAMATEGARTHRRSFADFCELQGLPRDFDLPGLSRTAKYRAVGNGVPLTMGRVIAAAVSDRGVTGNRRMCRCKCGRPLSGNQEHATPACRKRMERRRRVTSTVTGPGSVTAARSH